MRMIINIIAIIALAIQSFSFMVNIFCMKKPDDYLNAMWNYFSIFNYLCSVIVPFIFILYYNFNFKLFHYKFFNAIILLIVLFAGCVYLYQIAILRDFILTSFILILFSIYIAKKSFITISSNND